MSSSGDEEFSSTIIPGRSAKEMWFHEVLLSQRKFYNVLRDPDVDPEQIVLFTRQHLMLIFHGTVRQNLLRELDEGIHTISHTLEKTYVKRRYAMIAKCQHIIGEAMVFCYSTIPVLNQEPEVGES